MTNITTFGVRLVKETSARYETGKYIRSASDAANVLNTVFDMNNRPEEMFCAIFLNAKNKIIGVQEISKGTLTASLVHPREVLKGAILANAHGTIIAHNHPSGDITPSYADKQVTAIIRKACEVMQIELIDHVIIGDTYFSFRDNNILFS